MFDYLTGETVIATEGTSEGFLKPTAWLRIGEIRYIADDLADLDRLIEAAKETREALAVELGLVQCEGCLKRVEETRPQTVLVQRSEETGDVRETFDLCEQCHPFDEMWVGGCVIDGSAA